jgi:hypothetical protein
MRSRSPETFLPTCSTHAGYAPSTRRRTSSSIVTFDILPSVRIPRADQNLFPKPGSEDIDFHKQMLLVGLHFPLQPIARELLYNLWLSSFQIMPNGSRLFHASYMLWPEINLGHHMSILEFFTIYRPVYSKMGVLAFIIQVKL